MTSTSCSISKDLIAGFLVSLVALPLCLGIAMASGFPPAAGVLTAIVGGLVVNFLGGAQLTIKGPAAGLVVIALAAVTELGHGDMAAGYRYTLAIGVIAALLQIGLALVRAGSAAARMPPAVAYGMLAALGIIIIATQAHAALGVVPENQAPLALLFEIPSSVVHANPAIALIGLVSLVILFGFPLLARRVERLAKLPAVVVMVLVAVALGYGFGLEHGGDGVRVIGGESLISALAFPDFSQIGSLVSIKYIVMFALIGSIESTWSVLAVDSLDPAKRTSNVDRDLLTVGLGNLLASMVGGLPMISAIVRSKANIDAGASSRWANFFHGVLLLGAVALLPMMLEHVPLAALAAMLVFVGSQLLAPAGVKRISELGWDQLVLFLVTLVVSLVSDLLIGVGVGLIAKLVLDRARGAGREAAR